MYEAVFRSSDSGLTMQGSELLGKNKIQEHDVGILYSVRQCVAPIKDHSLHAGLRSKNRSLRSQRAGIVSS